MRDVETYIPQPEILLSQRTGDELDYEAARAVTSAHLFRVALKEIDEHLDLLWAKPGAKSLQGGYWYIWRRNPDAPPAFWQVCDTDGSYCDPDERHLKRMLAMDTSRSGHGGYGAICARRARRDAERKKAIEERHREFRERLQERLDHLYRPTIAVTAAMKARADGKPVTAGGVVLPDAIDRALTRPQESRAPASEASTTPPTAPNGGEVVELTRDPANTRVPEQADLETAEAA